MNEKKWDLKLYVKFEEEVEKDTEPKYDYHMEVNPNLSGAGIFFLITILKAREKELWKAL